MFLAVRRNELCQLLQPVGVKHFAYNVILTYKPQRALLAICRDKLLQDRHPVGVEHSDCNAIAARKPQCALLAVCHDKLSQPSHPVGVEHPGCNAIVARKPQCVLLAVCRDKLSQHSHPVGVMHSGYNALVGCKDAGTSMNEKGIYDVQCMWEARIYQVSSLGNKDIWSPHPHPPSSPPLNSPNKKYVVVCKDVGMGMNEKGIHVL